MNSAKKDKAVVSYEPEMLWPREFERFLEHAWIPWKATRRWRRPWMADEWMPDMDIFEREGKLVVRADLPDVKREDLEVSLEGKRLILHGQRAEEKEVNEKDYHQSERRTGTYTRTIPLPDGFDPNTIEATFSHGVLEVTVPKPAVSEATPIEIAVK